MLWTTWISLGALMGMTGVAAGAFGAHALKTRVDADLLIVFETAARYQMYHAMALVCLGLLASRIDQSMIQVSGHRSHPWIFGIGNSGTAGLTG